MILKIGGAKLKGYLQARVNLKPYALIKYQNFKR